MASRSARRLAPAWHTVVVLLAIGGITVWSKMYSDHLRTIANSPRLPLYALTAVFEWALLGLVLWGAPAAMVLGPRWQSGRSILRDIGISAAFWVVSGILLVFLSRLLHATSYTRNVQFMLPRTVLEMAGWIVLSITAGICEEAVFRGYLQPQLGGLTGSVPAGILLSAAIFGAGHAYQGARAVVIIGCYGAMFGLLAYWRRSVRPGMIAHAWQDAVSGILGARFG